MSFTTFALSVALVWLAIGIIVFIWMRRRGHAFFTWWYLGAILGPLSLPFAFDAVVGEAGFDLLVVGSRGSGASRALLDRVASHLARGVGVPVLLGDAPDVPGSNHSARRDDGSTVR